MERFVLDSSVTVAFLLDDENSPYADGILGDLKRYRPVVPSFWGIEVANAILVAERRKRLTSREADQALSLLQCLQVDVVDDEPLRHATAALSAARKYGLSTYDAAYLEIAQCMGLPLATLDQALRRAARKAGVELRS
ncbi:MAG TPA: type II toxin-antitoxin system VapC family toxin [Candidatus Hydrogenedentes bacterium]|nr:type II toxin-antitoxin system VapC family toxin [Candidatus Hydrogenedentota bacterium]HNT89473.1 type II toxin-antitoxin system VapC family toxin [Candidatus Hydrogenedentota bacterium]